MFSSTAALSEWEKLLLFDPQTSGGLLLAVSQDSYDEFKSDPNADKLFWKIGEIISEMQITIS